jgi:KaiC/GvpD/RAD55 family RecA-like ATPase
LVVSINGKWGVGKTYFWHQFKEQLTDKKVAYISLFGKTDSSLVRILFSFFFKSLTLIIFFCLFV